MPINVDDPLHPVDNDAANDPASAGAGELRALKAKLNNIFLSTGVDQDADHLITLNGRGLFVTYSAANIGSNDPTKILYGFAANVTRTGGTEHVVGAQFSAFLGPGLNIGPGQVFGIVTEAISNTTSQSTLVGAEFGVGALQPNNVSPILGCNIVFKNRGDGAAAPTGGLGANKYNTNSKGLVFSSQSRGTSGEFCGWNTGILFDEFSIDIANNVKGYAIDAYPLHYEGNTDPRFAYRCDAVLRMRTLQSIMWDDGVANKVRIFLSATNGRLVIATESAGVIEERWGVDVATGQVYKNGVLQY